jgi:hypothetical protein
MLLLLLLLLLPLAWRVCSIRQQSVVPSPATEQQAQQNGAHAAL